MNPQVGVAGLVSVGAAMFFGRLAGVRETLIQSNAALYNPVWTGLCVGLLIGLQPVGLLVAATAGVLAFAITVTLNGIFTDYLRLPVLSLPFVLVSSAVWLMFGGQEGFDAAVTVSALVLAATQALAVRFGVPAFTMPFNIVTLTFFYFLGRTGSPVMAKTLHDTPEETLDRHLSHQQRFGDPEPELALPFSGNWTLWQGFDGPWTHTGLWQHACDFIITRSEEHAKDAGRAAHSCAGSGRYLEDYHAWRKPVLAPCGGRVVRVISDLPDNPPGKVDKVNRWGNLVVIESTLGWFAKLSHFATDSIAVRVGNEVALGQVLGLCGNSGYSAQPHIHLQIQASVHIGAATLPFRFVSFLESNRFTARGLPTVGCEVRPLVAVRSLQYRASFPLGEILRYRVSEGEASGRILELNVRMDELGRYVLESGQGRLYSLDAIGFYFCRIDGNDTWLAVLFQAIPQLPLRYERCMMLSLTLSHRFFSE